MKREEPGRVRDAVYTCVKMNPGRRGVEIKMATSFNWASVRTALHRLMQEGKVRCDDSKRWEIAA